MAEHEHNGTEAPTPKRRETARRDGQTVQSSDVSSAVTLLASGIALMYLGPSIVESLCAAIRTWLAPHDWKNWTDFDAIASLRWMGWHLALLSTLVIVTLGTAMMAGFGQVGFVLTTKPLKMDWSRLAPSQGWKRLFSPEALARVSLLIVKLTLAVGAVTGILWVRRGELGIAGFSSIESLATYGGSLAITILLALAAVTLVVAVADYLVKWLQHERRMKMTHEELRQEQKDDQGDPHLRNAQRKRQREAVRRRSVNDVPEATVVLTNPTHLAVALKYDRNTPGVPRVVAKGAGVFAKNIVRIAHKHQIPVLERKPVARALYRTVEVGSEIPAELFKAVAEILAYIYRTEAALKKSYALGAAHRIERRDAS